MWPFGKKKTLAELAVERAPELVSLISKSWPKFLREMASNGMADVELEPKFYMFANRATEAIRASQPALRGLPDAYFVEVIAAGVVKSGTSTREDVEAALGFKIPAQLLRN